MATEVSVVVDEVVVKSIAITFVQEPSDDPQVEHHTNDMDKATAIIAYDTYSEGIFVGTGSTRIPVESLSNSQANKIESLLNFFEANAV